MVIDESDEEEVVPVEGPADLTTVTLRLEQLKWNYEGRQFSQKVAESKYALRFRAVTNPPHSPVTGPPDGAVPRSAPNASDSARPPAGEAPLGADAGGDGPAKEALPPLQHLRLVLEYCCNPDHAKTVSFDLLNDVDKLRYHVRAAPLTLALWSRIPLPACLQSAKLREEYAESERARRAKNEEDPQWILVVFFPPSELMAAQIMIHLLKTYFSEMDDVEPLTHEAAQALHDNDSQSSYSLAGQFREGRRIVNGHNVLDPAVLGKVDALRITRGDYNRLHEGIFLNDVVVDFYLHHLRCNIPEAHRGRFRLLSPFFWAAVRHAPGKAAQRWERDASFFGHDLVFVPISERRHWLLAVLCNLRHCFEPDAADLPHAAPQIALLDSMHTGAKFAKLVVPKLRLFLQERLRAEQRTGVLTAVPPERADPACLLPPRLREAAWPVPKQPNRHDCGCYMLQFAEDLLAAPPPAPAALASAAWVSEGRALGKRREIMALLDALREETELAGRRARRPPPGPDSCAPTPVEQDPPVTVEGPPTPLPLAALEGDGPSAAVDGA
eukprot:EG_transcript_6719